MAASAAAALPAGLAAGAGAVFTFFAGVETDAAAAGTGFAAALDAERYLSEFELGLATTGAQAEARADAEALT